MSRFAPFLPATAPFSAEQRAWLNGFFAATLATAATGGAPAPSTVAAAGATGVPTLPAEHRSDELGAIAPPGLTGDGYGGPTVVPSVGEHREEVPAYDRKNPFPARLLCCRPLNGDGSARDTRHIEISLAESGLQYDVGDALGAVPRNCPELVGMLIDVLGASANETIELDGEEASLFEALESRRDITSVSAAFLDALAERSGDAELNELLKPDKRPEKAAFLENRDYLDLLQAHCGAGFEPQAFVDLLRPLQHRLYSISSSLKAHPDEVHLTVGVVRYNLRDRLRQGVCSTFISNRVSPADRLPVFIHRNPNFRLPADGDRPVIMLGPGTGIAPFRAFLQERRATSAQGRNWLFFGAQHAATDFLYRDELEKMRRDNVLDRLTTAFSRDQDEKTYVQHRMLEYASDLYGWLQDGAHLYVCGDAARMAKDVDGALHKVVEIGGEMSPEASRAYVKSLKRAKRYARDVY